MATEHPCATISSTGIGSGLDVNGIVTQLMAIERQPLDAAAERRRPRSRRSSRRSASCSQLLSALRDAARTLCARPTWTPDHGSSSERRGGRRDHRQRRRAGQLRRRGAGPGRGADRWPATRSPRRQHASARARCTSSSAPGPATPPPSRRRAAPRAVDDHRSARRPTRWRRSATRSMPPTPASAAIDRHRRQRRAPGAALDDHRRGQRLPHRRQRRRRQRRAAGPVGARLRPAGATQMTLAQAAANAAATINGLPVELGQQHADRRGRRPDPDALGKVDQRAR